MATLIFISKEKKMNNFICWNCRGFKNKRHEIRELISDHGPICLALQETYLKINDTVSVRGYNCFRKDFHHPSRATGGIAILVSNNVPHTSIPLNTNLQALATQIHINQLITVSQSTSLLMIIFKCMISIILLCSFLSLLTSWLF